MRSDFEQMKQVNWGAAKTSVQLPICPFLPVPLRAMDWRDFNAHRAGDSHGAEFYETALLYAQYLWQRGFAARAILCIDRAMGADLNGEEPVLNKWPLPYAALAWMLREIQKTQRQGTDIFVGNPRVHFQHYAGRMNEPRREQRRWRAWACWAIARAVMPDLPGDARHIIEEPSVDVICEQLSCVEIAGETAVWRRALA